jgi:hypothetical protein
MRLVVITFDLPNKPEKIPETGDERRKGTDQIRLPFDWTTQRQHQMGHVIQIQSACQHKLISVKIQAERNARSGGILRKGLLFEGSDCCHDLLVLADRMNILSSLSRRG